MLPRLPMAPGHEAPRAGGEAVPHGGLDYTVSSAGLPNGARRGKGDTWIYWRPCCICGEEGTAARAHTRRRLAGKTGTAEIGDDKFREISVVRGYWVTDITTGCGCDGGRGEEEGPVKFEIARSC